jgi:hypothetical protein
MISANTMATRVAGLVATAILCAALAACAFGPTPTPGALAAASINVPESATPSGSDVASPDGSPGMSPVTSPVTGVLTHIDSAGLSKVTGFTMRLDDGREVTFRIGVLENGDQFPPGHLAEHLATSAPVRVYFRSEGGDLVAYRLEDGS